MIKYCKLTARNQTTFVALLRQNIIARWGRYSTIGHSVKMGILIRLFGTELTAKHVFFGQTGRILSDLVNPLPGRWHLKHASLLWAVDIEGDNLFLGSPTAFLHLYRCLRTLLTRRGAGGVKTLSQFSRTGKEYYESSSESGCNCKSAPA
jgi:hypothetical protein